MATDRMLTDQEEAFCRHYVQWRDAAKAYRTVYGDVETAQRTCVSNGYQTLQRPVVRARVEELTEAARAEAADATKFTIAKLLDWYLQMAAADPNELIGMKIGACRHCYGFEYKRQWKVTEYTEALDEAMRKGEPVPDVAGGLEYNHTAAPNPE